MADVALVGGRFLSADLADTYRGWPAEGAARAGRTLDDFETAPRLTRKQPHWTLQLAEAFTIVGTPNECAGQLGAVLDMGFTSASLNLAAAARSTAAEGLAETITSFAPVVATLTAS